MKAYSQYSLNVYLDSRRDEPMFLEWCKNPKKAWYNTVGTVLCPVRKLDISGPDLRWDCADEFERQCFPLLAYHVRDYPDEVIVAQVSYGSCPMCEIPQGVSMGH